MVTNLGKFLRKLRIDNGEILKDMADKLNVTASFLSAVENGKKRMPSEWNQRICELYELDADQTEAFSVAIAETEEKIELNFVGVSSCNRELAISFARKFSDFDEDEIIAIRNIMKKRGGHK